MSFYIKYFTITMCTIFICHKLLNVTYSKKHFLNSCIFSLLTVSFVSIINSSVSEFSIPLIILFTFIYLIATLILPVEIAITTTILSFSISYAVFSFSCLTVAILSVTIISFPINHLNISSSLASIMQVCLTPLLFIPKRLRKGMPFLINSTHNLALMLISLSILFLFLTIRNENNALIILILSFVSFLFALFIYIYWRNNLTRTYIEKLRERDIRDLNTQLDTTENILNEIKADKDRLSAIVHTDNKLVPAMIQAVESFLTDFPNATPEMVARGEEILHTLDGYMESRKDDLAEQDKKCFIKMTSTGIPAVNLTLEHLYAKAQANDITLAVNVEADVDFLSQTTISEDELNTMISDLLENAIIATSYTGNKRILFTIGMLGNALSISVFDSGIPFTKEVLVDFGREKHTTHGDTGGSGIGLMTIYEIAHKHRATIAIEEYDTEQSHYTKRIAITFNKRGNYILNTLRNKEEIAYLRQRTDLIINLKSE